MNNIQKGLYKLEIHPCFSIEGRPMAVNDLRELGYSYIKEGVDFQVQIGKFILEWIDDSPTLKVQTSGSTGVPKTIGLKKEYMVNSAMATGTYFNLFAKDTVLLCLPASYIAGKMMLVRAMVLGLDIHFVPPTSHPLEGVSRSFSFGAMVPMQAGNSLTKLHFIKKLIIGGAPIPGDLRDKLKLIANHSYETYGMTETITHIAVKPLNQLLCEGKVSDLGFKTLAGIEVAKDNRGCLVINAPKLSDELVTTNDVIELVSDSEFKWLGRIDNVINSGGIKLHPEGIEKLLSKYIDTPFFVAGLPDEVLGQKIVLVVEHVTEPEIQNIIDTITDFKKFEKPKTILVSKEFQRTESGKVQRSKTLEQILKA